MTGMLLVPPRLSRRLSHAATVLVLALLLGSGALALAQPVPITSPGAPYTQGFDTLASSGLANSWTDGVTLPGWYAYHTAEREGEPLGPPPFYRASDGNEVTGSLYSFGGTGSAERALGSQGSNSYGDVVYGVRLANATGGMLSALEVAYTGEQWRNGGNTSAQKLTFEYLVAAPGEILNISQGSWTRFSALDFTSPTVGSTTTALDGNLSSVKVSATILVDAADGQEIWLRWWDPNDSGNDHGLAVDDLSVTARSGGPPERAIHEIQGSGAASPLVGTAVRTRGVVTGVRSNGFFIQAQPSDQDGDPATSEGILVFTGTAPPEAAAVGSLVEVTGTVTEYRPAGDAVTPSVTEIAGAPAVTLLAQGSPLPAATALGATDLDPAGDLDQLERLEGMRVALPALTVVGPTMGSITEGSATATSTGVFYGVIAPNPRPAREPGIPAPDPLPLPGIPRFDGNPERLRVDSDALLGTVPLDVAAGAVVTGVTGPLDLAYRTWMVCPEPGSELAARGGATAEPLPLPAAGETLVATMNLKRLFDDQDDPALAEPVLSPAAFATRLAKASLAIRTVLRAPEIVAVQEVESLATLGALADRLNADSVAAGAADPAYQAYLEEGNDPGGIDVGFLVKGATVTVVRVTQEGKDTTLGSGSGLLNDRSPLLLEAVVSPGVGSPFPLTVINNHLRSMSDIDDPGKGPQVRAKRQEQAEWLAGLIQARQAADPQERIVCLGDLNAFPFNDGWVDVVGTVKGQPTPAGEVLLASEDLVTPDLVDTQAALPEAERYTFVSDGSTCELDHILVTTSLASQVARVAVARVGSDYPEVWYGDAARPERVSDHDAVVLALRPLTHVASRPPRRRLSD